MSKESSSYNDFSIKPMFNKKGFGRDLFVTEGNEMIRELGNHSGDSEERVDMFDLNIYSNNKSLSDMYSRRLS